jgi:hypothetical protein
MNPHLLHTLVLALAIVMAASAGFRLARMHFDMPGAGLWSLSKGPSAVLAVMEILAALFLTIPTTLVWGLILGTALLASHAAALGKMLLSDPVRT